MAGDKSDFGKLLFIGLIALQHKILITMFNVAVPILYKPYLSYTQIGFMAWSKLPFIFKLLWAPFVEKYHIERIGKRKTWLIIGQIIEFLVVLSYAGSMDNLLKQGEIGTVTIALLFIFFATTLQEIAIDGWAIEMLKE